MLNIANNLSSMNICRNMKNASAKIGKSSEKLSSGFKINRSADDAAGLAISTKIKSQVVSLNKASRNVEDGISLIKTADASMSEIGAMLGRQRELTIQAMNDTNSEEDVDKIKQEIDQLSVEINNMSRITKFNGIPLLNRNSVGAISIDEAGASYSGTIKLSDSSPVTNVADMINLNKGDSFTIKLENLTNPGDMPNMALLVSQTSQGNLSGDGVDIANPPYDGSLICESIDPTADGAKINNINKDGFWGMQFIEVPPSGDEYKITINKEVSESDNELFNKLHIQSGANEGQSVYIDTYDCSAKALGIENLYLKPLELAEESLGKIDNAADTLNGYRANAGAQQNRLEHIESALSNYSLNLESANSRIVDTDMASEMMTHVKNNTLQQAGMSMLAQANQAPERILSIIR